MTITREGADGEGKPRWTCTWFDSEHNEKSGVYPSEALKLYKEETGSSGDDDVGGDFMTR